VSLFCGGISKEAVTFNVDVSGILSSLMVVSSASLIIPSVLYSTISSKSPDVEQSVLSLSRAASVVLLAFYLVYLYFQLKSHSELFVDDEPEEEEEQVLGPWVASIVLILATLGVTVCSDCLVESVDGFVEKWHVSRAFIGLIVVPIVGNAGEFNTVVNSSLKGNMDLAIGVVVGSTLQIALFVSPFLVICGMIIGQPMSLRYSPFETVVFFLSVIVMDCLIRGGRSNYYEGCLLVGT
jgi:Ca2+:H+ antiporter